MPDWPRARAGGANGSGELTSTHCSLAKRASTCGRPTLATAHVCGGRRSPISNHTTILPADVFSCAHWPRMLQTACRGHTASGPRCSRRTTPTGPCGKCALPVCSVTRWRRAFHEARCDVLRRPCGRGGLADRRIDHPCSPAGSSSAGLLGHGRGTAARWADPCARIGVRTVLRG